MIMIFPFTLRSKNANHIYRSMFLNTSSPVIFSHPLQQRFYPAISTFTVGVQECGSGASPRLKPQQPGSDQTFTFGCPHNLHFAQLVHVSFEGSLD